MALPALALTACIRDEAEILPAFLAYHGALGVTRAWLYLDRCSDATREVLRDFPWVEAEACDRDPDVESLEQVQLRCADDALARARREGATWLLHLDADEFAWGGPLAFAGSATHAGSLTGMLARVQPQTEMVVLRTLESIPTRRPPERPFWEMHDFAIHDAIARNVLDPLTGKVIRLERPLGHGLGKSIARVAADLQSASAHRWTRRQDVAVPALVPLAEETLGVHFHYVVRSAAHWLEKFRKLSPDPDVWLRGAPLEFPKLSWKKAAPTMSRRDAERYFADWVAVPDDLVADARVRGMVTTAPHLERVLQEIGFAKPRSHARSRRRCRVAFIGLDAFDPALLDRWTGEGRLPILAALRERSLVAQTEGPEGFFVGALWPSLYTGVGPGRHGCHSWEQLEPGSYAVTRYLASRNVKHTPFWRTLSDAGRRVALLDVPLAGASPGLNGLQIVEWGGHDPEEGFCTEPPELADEILCRFGPHPVQGNCNALRSPVELARFRDDLVQGVRQRTALHRWLLGRDDWDLFFTVYGESHCVGHQCWHVHDPTHVRHDAESAAWIGDPLLDVYQAIDRSLGELLALLDPDATIAVLASHGMGPHYDPTFLLDDMLRLLEASGASALRSRAAHARTDVLAQIAPTARHARIANRAAALTLPERACFQVNNNQVDGAIRINLAGREPQGIVQPGPELDRLCERIAAALGTFVNVDTGNPIVERVVRTQEVHCGEAIDRLPDLYVLWRKDGYVRHVRSPLVGDLMRDYDGCRTGDHTPRGRLLLAGPHVRPGVLSQPLHAVDVAPTVAAMLGVALPDVDGRAVAALVRAAGASLSPKAIG
jgi:predicted AlkP superfamily phosphohydrolase/phosphomutase